ncbi:acyltransferase [Actinoplanes sp. ATCC 53533]|uniref:acyltransferase family protein n=1 Tax=Actinoplanes sp. ATCC 53533 TaxID=1288362 RepID=UPI000F76D704|nr:acyltransferase [Actinoplanes sp. ATCC 53533]RSM62218.1 acyltransferase [Actinoplanes sp. ATCC 53533]
MVSSRSYQRERGSTGKAVRGPRLAVIDGLRLLAALAVAFYHYTVAWRIDGVRTPEYYLPQTVHWSVYGFLGVEVFFLISGFVICMSGWGRGLGDFFVSRASRLYPAYWAAVLLTAAVAVLVPTTTPPPGFGAVLTNLTMLQQPLGVPDIDSVYWTLFVELRFYLIMAVVLHWGLTYRRAVILCAGWLTAAVIVPSLGIPALNLLLITDYAPYFIGGIALYLIHRFGPSPLLYGVTGMALLVCLSRVHNRIAMMRPGFPMSDWPGIAIITAGFAALLLIALGRTDRIAWRWLTVAGALTYPFYLLHMRIGQTAMRAAFQHTTAPMWSLVLVTMLGMLVVAWCVHRYVERPLTTVVRAALRRGIAATAVAESARPAPAREPALVRHPAEQGRPAEWSSADGQGSAATPPPARAEGAAGGHQRRRAATRESLTPRLRQHTPKNSQRP